MENNKKVERVTDFIMFDKTGKETLLHYVDGRIEGDYITGKINGIREVVAKIGKHHSVIIQNVLQVEFNVGEDN